MAPAAAPATSTDPVAPARIPAVAAATAPPRTAVREPTHPACANCKSRAPLASIAHGAARDVSVKTALCDGSLLCDGDDWYNISYAALARVIVVGAGWGGGGFF